MATVAAVALPPVSRKLATEPPEEVSASTVFMARPAPLTGGLMSVGGGRGKARWRGRGMRGGGKGGVT